MRIRPEEVKVPLRITTDERRVQDFSGAIVPDPDDMDAVSLIIDGYWKGFWVIPYFLYSYRMIPGRETFFNADWSVADILGIDKYCCSGRV